MEIMGEKNKDKKEGVEKDICGLLNVVQYIFYFPQKKQQVWNDMMVNEWWQNLYFLEIVFVDLGFFCCCY